jgi:hypothetical protein
LTALACAAVFALQSGCAEFPPRPPEVPKTQYQAALGKVAVVATPQQPVINFKSLPSGKGEGAAQGVGSTFSSCVGMLGEGGCSGDMCGAAYILWLGVCSVAGVVGGVVGAVAAPSAAKVRTAKADLSAALGVKTIQESLRDNVVAAANARGASLVSVSPESAQAAAQSRDYRALAAAGADTVLEVTLTKVGPMALTLLGKEVKAPGSNPRLPLGMTAYARLIRTDDNAEIFAAEYVFLGETIKVSEWSDNQAQRLLHNLQVGYQTLGAHIYDSVFMLYPFPDREAHYVGFMAHSFGLAPVYPLMSGPGAEDDVFFYPTYWRTVDSLRPTLRWQSFPRATDIKAAPDEMGRVRNVRYDLVIAEEQNLAPADVVYRREGLPDPVHAIEASLKPATRYFWTVRARFELDGRERVTEWGTVNFWFFQGKWTSPLDWSYRFKTPK